MEAFHFLMISGRTLASIHCLPSLSDRRHVARIEANLIERAFLEKSASGHSRRGGCGRTEQKPRRFREKGGLIEQLERH